MLSRQAEQVLDDMAQTGIFGEQVLTPFVMQEVCRALSGHSLTDKGATELASAIRYLADAVRRPVDLYALKDITAR